jgi:uncharacterized protein
MINSSLAAGAVRKFIYACAMGRYQVSIVKLHLKVLLGGAPPSALEASNPFQVAVALKNPSIMEYDSLVTSVVGGPPPHFPFKSVDAYYTWASSYDVLADVKVPLCSINAMDDPMVPHIPYDFHDNPNVVMVRPSGGGHLGFYEGYNKRWTVKRVVEWMVFFGDTLAVGPRSAGALFLDKDGWIADEANPNLGCRESDGGGVIDGSILW